MAKVGQKVHIVIDLLTKDVVNITDTFIECEQILANHQDGELRIETWIYNNDLQWVFEQDSDYLVQNGLVYKLKYRQEEKINAID